MFSKLSYSICHIYIYITVLVQIKKKTFHRKRQFRSRDTLKSLEKMYLNHFLKTAQ